MTLQVLHFFLNLLSRICRLLVLFTSSRVIIDLLWDVTVDQSDRVVFQRLLWRFSVGAQRIVGSPCTMCSSTTLVIAVGIGIYCEFFKGAQSAGFGNFQAFLWYNQGKWPLEPSKVKKFRLALFVSKHAVRIRWVGDIEPSFITTRTFALQALKTFAFRTVSLTVWLLLYPNSFKKAASARTRRQNGE